MPATLHPDPPLSSLQRLTRLLKTERNDIFYILLFAIATGLIGLIIPLGIQAVFNWAASGLFNSIYVLIALVTSGVLAGGLLTTMQYRMVELIQQRLFVKAAFEITCRLPRIKPEALNQYYPPELLNRFFEVVTLQKGFTNLLIDVPAATVQILFGLILLSCYHPIFLTFGLVTGLVIYGAIRLFGPEGARRSSEESSDVYQVVDWLETYSLHLAESRPMPQEIDPIDQMDNQVATYVSHRNEHFRVLKRFFYSSVAFRTLVTGGMLILGTSLVVSRQLSLGQFVASELIIVLITGAVDKLTSGIDTVFDMLAGVEKLGEIVDLPLQKDTAAPT